MTFEEDFLFKPVLAGMFDAMELLGTTIDLDFVGQCNEALEVKEYNDFKLRQK